MIYLYYSISFSLCTLTLQRTVGAIFAHISINLTLIAHIRCSSVGVYVN